MVPFIKVARVRLLVKLNYGLIIVFEQVSSGCRVFLMAFLEQGIGQTALTWLGVELHFWYCQRKCLNGTLGNAEKKLSSSSLHSREQIFCCISEPTRVKYWAVEILCLSHQCLCWERVSFFPQTSTRCNLGILFLLGYSVAWQTKDVKDEEKCLLVIWFYCGC